MLSVNAIGFQTGVSYGQELVWKCNVCNNNEMDNIFGPTWDDSGIFSNLNKGKRMKWNISAVEINQTFLTIHFNIWEWTSETSWGVKDYDSQISYFSNPDQYPPGLNFSQDSSLVPFLFPIPVVDYMGELILSEWYDVDNRVLPTLNVDIKENAISPGTPSRDINIIAIYNDQGILNSYKLYIRGNIVIIDISFEFLPFYVIPTLIGLVSVFVLIIIFGIKKRKIRSNPIRAFFSKPCSGYTHFLHFGQFLRLTINFTFFNRKLR